MNACPYLAVLFCLVGLGIHVSESTPSPTPNPECSGLNRIAKNLETGIKSYTKETTICRVNDPCTGVMCNGTHKQNDFYMKMELKHCKTPPEIHLDLIYKKFDIKFHREMRDGKQDIGKGLFKLKLTLQKKRNRITAGLTLQTCPLGMCSHLATLLPRTTFCVNMKTCPGYNSTGDVPCHINPTGLPLTTTSTTATTELLSTVTTVKASTEHSNSTSSTPTPRSHSEPIKISTMKYPTKASLSTFEPRSHSPTKNTGNTTAMPGNKSARKGESGHHHMSAGVIVGIVFACVVGVLIILGAAFYWKKFYRRARLRAAYYNDISMNDPLYEDFGPEVA